VEARTVTEYPANVVMDTREQRNHRHAVKLATNQHHGRLVNDFEKPRITIRRHASWPPKPLDEPKFTDWEKINLELYAERPVTVISVDGENHDDQQDRHGF